MNFKPTKEELIIATICGLFGIGLLYLLLLNQ